MALAVVSARRAGRMPESGKLREVLAFQEDTVATDAIGGKTSSWATLQTLRGMVVALSGREVMQADAINSNVAYRVTVRQGQLEAASVSVTSITESSGTATVTAAAAHGLTTGEYMRVLGADQGDYNVRALATVTNTTVYTYPVSNSPASPATGTITLLRLRPISAQMRILWTPSWDGSQAAKTLEVLAMRPYATDPRRWIELDCGEVN